jgi:hypothetical protein
MTTEAIETIQADLEATIDQYHMAIGNKLRSTENTALPFYASGALVVRIDGKLLVKGRIREGTDFLGTFWIQRLFFREFKAVMETVELKTSNDSAYEICRFHWNYNTLDEFHSPEQVIEEGHYLAVWNYSPEDQRWLITAQAFSSADTELSRALDELHPEYQFKARHAPPE